VPLPFATFFLNSILVNGGNMKKTIVTLLIGILLGSGIALFAAVRHPNLVEAHNLILKAILRIDLAQKANEYDLGGHAAKAKEHLAAAETEIKLAAEAAAQ
jgi:hypothetical protein